MDNNEEKQTHELINELLKRKDPALVGIRKILRAKSDSISSTRSFNMHAPEVFNIETEEKSRENETIFTDKEIVVLEAEKKILELEDIIRQKDEEIKEATEKSYEAGKSDGIAESQEKTKTIINEIENKIKTESQARLTTQINQELEDRLKHFKSLEEDIYQLIVLCIKKILATEIISKPYLIINIIKKSLSYLSQRDEITIRVSKDDYEYVKESISSFNRHNDGIYTIDVIPDEHIKTGGCLIETNSTIVDAQVEKRTENVLELVEKIYNETKNSDTSNKLPDESETNEESDNQEVS
ncbi:MAG: hypothetical protein LBH98_04495 [Chitinispirillales bacterium]|jgi:flagellar assembly protein FliH|nr:hypothetical protein [Chitinispirillales bacterium]